MPLAAIPDPTIAIQGEKASFHDVAAERFFGAQSQRVYCDTFEEAFVALHNKQANYALCAIENSLYGSINDVYDLLSKYDCTVIGEVYLRIEQCLIGIPDTPLEAIETVYSHPVALAQCTDYLDKTLPQAAREEHFDTAGSVKFISELNDPSTAAIASHEAAKLYGMKVLAKSIETNKENYTRFVCLSNSPDDTPLDANKTSLILNTGDEAGSLYRALGCFAERNINISKIQSRPIIGKAWSYMFYLDARVGAHDLALRGTIDELQAQGCSVKILGSYRNGLSAQS